MRRFTYTPSARDTWRQATNPRYDVTGTCTACGATYTATGTKDFVDGVVAEFTETHQRLHGERL